MQSKRATKIFYHGEPESTEKEELDFSVLKTTPGADSLRKRRIRARMRSGNGSFNGKPKAAVF